MRHLKVIKAGLFTTIQDKGRYGYANKGITQSGVMDEISYNYLNKLLQNKEDTNSLEIAFGNIELYSDVETYICVTGAKCEFFINKQPKQNYKVYKINIGDTIKVGKILEGQIVYLSVKGGFHIEKELGSNSTTIKESIGGLNGDKLKNNDTLPCSTHHFTPLTKLKKRFIPRYEDNEEIVLRVVLGYQEQNFKKDQKEKFFGSSYTITKEFDKMGCKLDGVPIVCDIKGIVSEAISFGAIQIPPNGQPIILLKNRQTIGGYPKIGFVIQKDCYKLSQMKIGSKVKFKQITLEKAIELERSFKQLFI